MKIVSVQQGSEEWLRARAGIPTASSFDRILTPTGKQSKQSHDYICQLIAERMSGLANDNGTQWMNRGSDLEREAVAWYCLEQDVEVSEVGFCTTDDGRWGCSPDRLVGDEGLLELKCPAAHTHIGYLLDHGPGNDYRPQIQGQILVTGRQWVDFVSYCPGLPALCVRFLPNGDYLELLQAEMELFSVALNGAEQTIRGMR